MAEFSISSHKLEAYISLTKPRVMLANALTSAAGYLLASGDIKHFYAWRFIALVTGSSLIIAAACALNNYLDRDIDSRMERTKNRVTVTGEVGKWGAVIFSTVTVLAGTVILSLWTNWLVVAVGLIGFVDYVWLYGALSKRKSVHGTLVGCISGAIPVLAGYLAVTNKFDVGAGLVFISLFFWQLPEFYSIAIYRRKEYAAAGVPVISVVRGLKNTKDQIFIYTLLFVVSSLLLTAFGYTGWIYLIVMGGLGGWWLRQGWRGRQPASGDRWARQMFHFSMIIILAYCLMLSIGALLP